jgi:hypothetical protein
MKNITFFNQMKGILRNECNAIKDDKTEIKTEEINNENIKQETVSKLNFQLFDIDQVFAN